MNQPAQQDLRRRLIPTLVQDYKTTKHPDNYQTIAVLGSTNDIRLDGGWGGGGGRDCRQDKNTFVVIIPIRIVFVSFSFLGVSTSVDRFSTSTKSVYIRIMVMYVSPE